MNEHDEEEMAPSDEPTEQPTIAVAQASGPPVHRRKLGRVESDKMMKTIVVSVENLRRHRLYHRAVKRTKRFKVHDEMNEARAGDVVEIEECRPISKRTHWRLVRVVTQGAAR